ncbi:hypothetical protein DOTSEDRAFT_90064 [Lecanosticta acicola]|uniref:F-box domain-containing protein n=1 Tax=Lecanosticta acicola TaxID=111012 RepID=A0AAI8YV08_9PEZI|nr:hypothetical protein DOTSEDRAFT_90064 [Lecanosticta acicola]
MSVRFRIKTLMEKFAAMNTEVQFRLLDLPNELIAHIIEQVDSVKALRKLSQTCRRVQELTEPFLYRVALVRSGRRAEAILRSLETRRARAAAIRRLDVPCDYHQHQNFEALSSLLRQARNLKTLMIESPQCNNGDFEDEPTWRVMAEHIFSPFHDAVRLAEIGEPSSRPLHNLRELTLHLNGIDSPYWTPSGSSLAIFQIPTLQYLKISCVNILDDLAKQLQDKPRTPLKHLELEECNITHLGLYGILSVPEALETLYLGENIYNITAFMGYPVDPASNHLFQTNPKAALHALQQQQGSLQSLTYATNERIYQHMQLARQILCDPSPVDAGFAGFHCLQHVTLVGQCPNFERALMTSKSPPILKTLEHQEISPLRRTVVNQASPLDSVPFLRAPSCSIPTTLESVDITYQSISLMNSRITEAIKNEFIQPAAVAVETMGVRMRVFNRQVAGYFPPYLYGEPRPVSEMLFTGYRDGFVGKLSESKPRSDQSSSDGDEESTSEFEDTEDTEDTSSDEDEE